MSPNAPRYGVPWGDSGPQRVEQISDGIVFVDGYVRIRHTIDGFTIECDECGFVGLVTPFLGIAHKDLSAHVSIRHGEALNTLS